MNKTDLILKIKQKKEFSELPKKDISLALSKFDNPIYSDEEKIKKTRDLLRKVFSGFTSQKILSLKDKTPEWILRKHLSTRERLPHYREIYKRLFDGFDGRVNIFDFGAGVNGFSYKYIEEFSKDFYYVGVESIGQLVKLMNYYFKTRGIENCAAFQMSLFELSNIKKYIKQVKGKKLVFLFKIIDSLEMLKKDYSKEFISEISPLVDKIVISFATRSMIKRTRFKAKRSWIINFLENNFKILNDFEIGNERYLVFCKKQDL